MKEENKFNENKIEDEKTRKKTGGIDIFLDSLKFEIFLFSSLLMEEYFFNFLIAFSNSCII